MTISGILILVGFVLFAILMVKRLLPTLLALPLMAAAKAFVFLGMSGLGAVIMIGSIVIPIMTSAGVEPIDAVILILLGMITGSVLNFAGRQKPRWKSPLNMTRKPIFYAPRLQALQNLKWAMSR